MGERKRVNISVDPQTYDALQRLKVAYGFSSTCELVVAFVHILLDRLQKAGSRKYDLPDDDGAYIDEMFDELSYTMRVPNGEGPGKKHKRHK